MPHKRFLGERAKKMAKYRLTDKHDVKSKVICKELLWTKRHIECNLCIINGKKDGTMIRGRQAHVRVLNTARMIRRKAITSKIIQTLDHYKKSAAAKIRGYKFIPDHEKHMEYKLHRMDSLKNFLGRSLISSFKGGSVMSSKFF